MPTIPYSTDCFKAYLGPSVCTGSHFLVTSWPEIVRSAVTVGRAGWKDVFQHGRYSIAECWYRQLICQAYLKEDSSGALMRTAEHRHAIFWIDC